MKAASTTKKGLPAEAGSGLIEILIAIAVLALGVSAAVLLSFANQTLKIDSETNSEALGKAQALLENERAESRLAFNLVNPILPFADGIYTKRVEVEAFPPDFLTKKVTSVVNWLGEGNRSLSIELSTLVTNYGDITETCNSVLSGDWANPQLLGNVDVGQNNGATDVDILMRKAYVTADPAASEKPDFFIIDVSDPNASPLPIFGGDGIDTGEGLEAVHVSGNYAYVANRSINGQLQVIDISNHLSPFIATTTKIISVTGGGAYGKSIFYTNGYVYLGLYNTATGPEFNILDVSDPLEPVWKGGYSINHEINAIYVKDDLAYIASPDNQELIILDVSDPENPILHADLNLSDNSANGKSIDIVGNTLFLGRTVGLSPATREFQLVDITDTSDPDPTASANVDSTINALRIRDNLAFMVTNEPSLGFQIWDLNTMTLYGSENVEQTSTGGMDCEGNYIYIAQRSNKALQIVGPGP